MPFVIAAIVIIVVAVVAVMVTRNQKAPATAPTSSAPATASTGVRPAATDFHVDHGDAHVYFSVPVGDGDVDPILRDILLREAVEVLREKRSKLPLDGVSTVHAHALRAGAAVEIGHLSLDGPGVLPPAPSPADHPLLSHHGPDIFAEFGGEAAPPPAVADRSPADELPPLGAELRFTATMEAGLRTQGIDPATAPMSLLVPGVLRLSGYAVSGEGSQFTATQGGMTTFVEIVDHTKGEHPELAERAVNEFMVHYGQSGAQRGLLFTAKYGPFMVYDKERREPRVRFVTRERFQSFVDATALG